jgi:hypothetical protein
VQFKVYERVFSQPEDVDIILSPVPPFVIQPDSNFSVWTGLSWRQPDDSESYFPPVPPSVFQFDDSLQVWSALMWRQPGDLDNYLVPIPPVVAPNIGIDDIESTILKRKDLAMPPQEAESPARPFSTDENRPRVGDSKHGHGLGEGNPFVGGSE